MLDQTKLPQNASPLGREALRWLKEAEAETEPHVLHLLTLAAWGIEEGGAEGEWPARDRPAVEMQVGALQGWPAPAAINWLFSNPNAPSPEEQQASLLANLRAATSPAQAASLVLNEIYSRQVADNPSLQPASSGSP